DPNTSAVYAGFDFEIDKSSDAGQTWTTVATSVTLHSFGMQIRSLTFTKTQPFSTLYVDFGANDTIGATDLQRSRDGGVTWKAIPGPSGGMRDPHLVAADPSDPM